MCLLAAQLLLGVNALPLWKERGLNAAMIKVGSICRLATAHPALPNMAAA
jgi:hypothetical protein